MAKAEKQRSAPSVDHIVQGMVSPYIDVKRRTVQLHLRTELIPADTSREASELEALAAKCKRALTEDPENVNYLLSIANSLSDIGKFEDSIPAYDAILVQYPKRGDAAHFRAIAKARLGDYEGARADFSLAFDMALDPKLFNIDLASVCVDFAWFLSTCPQMGFRRADEALKYAKRANELLRGTNSVDPDICFAVAYAQKKEFSSALAYLKKTEKRAADQPIQRNQLIFELFRELVIDQPHWQAFQAPVVRSVHLTTAESQREKEVVERNRAGEAQSEIDLAREALIPLRDNPKAIREVLQGVSFSPSAKTAIVEELSNKNSRVGTAQRIDASNQSPEELLARNVKDLRKARQWSERQLASEVGVSQRSVQLIEGALVSCQLDTLCQYGAAFERSPRAMLFPDLVKKPRSIEPVDALAALATTLRKRLPPGRPAHKSVEGILAERHFPSLRVLNEIAESIGTSLAELLP